MNLDELASKYIDSAAYAFKNMKLSEYCVTIDSSCISKVTELAMAYMQDAKYYKERKKFKVSLTSIAYCEGLLDALRLIGAVKFEWPTTKAAARRGLE